MYNSYVKRHMNISVLRRKCHVIFPQTGKIESGVIVGVKDDWYSEHVTVEMDNGDTLYLIPETVFLSYPVAVTYRDIFGTVTNWEESDMRWRD